MKLRRGWIAVVMVGVLIACTNVKEKKFTTDNTEKLLKEIGESKDVSAEERDLFLAYMIRHGIADAFAGKDVKVPTGKSFGEMVAEQRAWMEAEKAREKKEKELAAKAKAEEEARQKELRDALTVSVFDKGFEAHNMYAGDFDDKVTLKVAYQNNTKKDVKAFKGVLTFKDTFGDKIYSSGLKDDEGIKAGGTRNVNLFIKYNQFIDSNVKLKNADLAKSKIEFQPVTIMFADGSTLGDKSGD